jgi:hypothetical protein
MVSRVDVTKKCNARSMSNGCRYRDIDAVVKLPLYEILFDGGCPAVALPIVAVRDGVVGEWRQSVVGGPTVDECLSNCPVSLQSLAV